jgi:hypothetical protein
MLNLVLLTLICINIKLHYEIDALKNLINRKFVMVFRGSLAPIIHRHHHKNFGGLPNLKNETLSTLDTSKIY